MQLIYLFKGLELTPAIAKSLVSSVSAEKYDQFQDPDRFSFRCAVAHLSDWELINQERFRRTVEEPGCTVMGLDPDERATEREYANTDPVEEVAKFDARRQETLAYLKGLAESDWEKISYHSERGKQTLYELAASILGHDVVHLEQFSQFI